MVKTATRVYLGKQGQFPGWWVVGGCFSILFFGSALGFYGMGVYLNAYSKQFNWEISSLYCHHILFLNWRTLERCRCTSHGQV